MLDVLDALPAPRTPDAREAPAVRWGILGPGWIAERFVASLRGYTRQEVTAVGSRSHDRAAAFADPDGHRPRPRVVRRPGRRPRGRRLRPLADSITALAVMDQARAQVGIRFDDE